MPTALDRISRAPSGTGFPPVRGGRSSPRAAPWGRCAHAVVARIGRATGPPAAPREGHRARPLHCLCAAASPSAVFAATSSACSAAASFSASCAAASFSACNAAACSSVSSRRPLPPHAARRLLPQPATPCSPVGESIRECDRARTCGPELAESAARESTAGNRWARR